MFSTTKSDSPSIFSRPADSISSPGLFGKPAASSSGGASVLAATLRGETSKITFGSPAPVSPAVAPVTSPQAPDTTGPVFGSSNLSETFNFSSMAKGGEGFKTATEGFRFAGAGASLFSSPKATTEDGEGGEDDEEAAHDPYFEPIVPLPELVEVKTGEEDEDVLFKHRAKVYRYCGETKQWKERGVGDIKILRHQTTGVHRVLLRRDQVHKIAANHRITPEMELKPLASSETAWCWYAMDFSEGHEAQGSLEHLAVRFKTADTAKEFKDQFVACQSGAVTASSAASNNVTNEPQISATSTTAAEDETEEDEEDYCEEDDYDEALETVMFRQTVAQLSIKDDKSGNWVSQGEVDFRIVYDDDVYGARIIAESVSGHSDEDYNVVCNHLIAMQTVLTESPDMSWSALDFSVDPPTHRTFKVEFPTPDIASEFRDMFAEGKDLAEQSEILESVGDQDPANFYYGQGADGEA